LRFRYDASAISTTLILIAVALVLLALCGWPFLRIALIDPRQALTITDVVLIVICTIVGAAVITLALLDAFAYRNMTRTADEQLGKYSETLQANFRGNVRRAMDMLADAERATAAEAQAIDAAEPGEPACGDVVDSAPNQLKPELFQRGPIAQYPYISSIFWIDASGMQRVRFGRTTSALQCVADRTYFKLANRNLTWTIDGRPYVLEWVRSKSTGDVRAIFARKTNVAPFSVIAVSTEVIDLTHAAGPPGAEMAIIAENGDVIYHSDPQRFGYENFFITSDMNPTTRFVHWISLYRADPDAHCREDERQMLARLRPHLMQALALNRIRHLNCLAPAARGSQRGMAIADLRGVIYHAAPEFEDLLRTEWNGSRAGVLPSALLEQFLKGADRVVGRTLVVRRQVEHRLQFLSARLRCRADALTVRERSVADLIARGATHKEVARQLARAPATIRNHIQAIYAKLEVANVAGLIEALQLAD